MKRRHGFTLVELLVVIGIIALLIGILLPALNKARQQANKAACLSNLHGMGLSIAGYVGTYKGVLPEGVDAYRNVSWWSLLAQQMGNHFQAIGNLGANSTADLGKILINEAAAGGDKRLGIFRCKDAQETQPASINDYSCHPLLMPDLQLKYPAGFPIPNPTTTPRQPYRITKIPNPAEIVLIFDGSQSIMADLQPTGTPPPNVPIQAGDASPCAYNLDNNRIASGGAPAPKTFLTTVGGFDLGQSVDGGPNIDSPNDPGTAGDPQRKWANIRWRHSGNTVANFLYVDGHAGSLSYNTTTQHTTHQTGLLRRNVCVPPPQ